MVAVTAPTEPLGFAQLLINLLDEGRRTATYKLAVLLALVDSTTLGADERGRPPSRITTRDLARRVVELYWPQVRPFPLGDGRGPRVELRQSTQARAVTVDAVRELRAMADRAGATTPYLAERTLPADFAACLDTVELNLVRMPLGKLQRPAGFTEKGSPDYPRFLYDDSTFHESISIRQVRERQMYVELRPSVADWLVSLAGLIRPLLELHWTREVARFNHHQLPEDRLQQFLFGAGRVPLQRLGPGLRDLQDGHCFYCRAPLRDHRDVEVDHFVPWSRIPNDSLGNLVLADKRCNNSKRNHLADLELLRRWATRPAQALAQVADAADWPLRLTESARIARGIYAHAPPGTHLWSEPGVFRVLATDRLSSLLATLERP